MATRKIKDAVDRQTNEKIYFRGHAQATFTSDGKNVEEKLEQIAESVGNKQDTISDLATIRSNANKGATALQSVPAEYVTETELTNKGYATTSAMNTALGDKVDKVSGKQLSTEDFTTALKNKLSSLNNYDDTTINNAISSLQTQLNTLVGGNASTAIESFNEIIAFLDSVTDTQTLEGIIAGIEQQISGKQAIISDLAAIRSGANAGATAVQPTSLASVATSGSYNDLNGKPSLNEVNGILSIEKGGTGAATPEDARSNLDVYSKAEINELLISNEIDLPNGYTELEYIESTGTQYIDTGFIANQDSRVIIDAKFKTVPTNYEAIFGSRNGDAQGFWLYYRPAQGMFAYRYGSTGTNYFVNADPLAQNEFDANKNKITVGGNFATAPEDTFNCASTLYLFAVNATTSIGYTSKLIMYSCRIYDNGTLARNFIPCINSSDEIGMYDLVNEVFYGNAGSGEFLSGPAVLKNVTPIEQGGTGATNAADARANLGITPANIGAPTVSEMNTAISNVSKDINEKVSSDGTITKIVKVTSMPSSPDSQTLYIVMS